MNKIFYSNYYYFYINYYYYYVSINYCSYIGVSIFLSWNYGVNSFISYCGVYEATTRTDKWYGRK